MTDAPQAEFISLHKRENLQKYSEQMKQKYSALYARENCISIGHYDGLNILLNEYAYFYVLQNYE